MVSDANVAFCGDVGGEEMDEDEWSEAASSSRIVDRSPNPGGMAMTWGERRVMMMMMMILYRHDSKTESDCKKTVVNASDCRRSDAAIIGQMDQSDG